MDVRTNYLLISLNSLPSLIIVKELSVCIIFMIYTLLLYSLGDARKILMPGFVCLCLKHICWYHWDKNWWSQYKNLYPDISGKNACMKPLLYCCKVVPVILLKQTFNGNHRFNNDLVCRKSWIREAACVKGAYNRLSDSLSIRAAPWDGYRCNNKSICLP